PVGLHGVADDDDAPARPGHGPLDQNEVALGVGLDDLEVEGGDLLATETSGHLRALEDPAGERASADRARRPVHLVVAVAGALTREVVALHGAGPALAAADGGDVNPLALFEDLGGDLLADGEAVDVVEAQLDQLGAGVDPGLGEVAGLGLVQLAGVPVAVGDLARGAAIALAGLHPDDAGGGDPGPGYAGEPDRATP